MTSLKSKERPSWTRLKTLSKSILFHTCTGLRSLAMSNVNAVSQSRGAMLMRSTWRSSRTRVLVDRAGLCSLITMNSGINEHRLTAYYVDSGARRLSHIVLSWANVPVTSTLHFHLLNLRFFVTPQPLELELLGPFCNNLLLVRSRLYP